MLPKMHVPTKSEVEASNMRKQERSIMIDIAEIDKVLNSSDVNELIRLHKYLDGKYQYCIADWGKSMYAYNPVLGFSYELLDEDSLRENLTLMKPKLDAFKHGWNAITTPRKNNRTESPDVNVTVNNNITVNITFEQVREKIEEMTSLTEEQTKEALEKIDEIEKVVKGNGSKKSKWEKLKPFLVWMADKSFDVGMTMLPLLLQLQ